MTTDRHALVDSVRILEVGCERELDRVSVSDACARFLCRRPTDSSGSETVEVLSHVPVSSGVCRITQRTSQSWNKG